MRRWVEHYIELCTIENSVTKEALDVIEGLSVPEVLGSEPRKEELRRAIDVLPCDKVQGEDSIPPEIIKCGKPALLKPLHSLIRVC